MKGQVLRSASAVLVALLAGGVAYLGGLTDAAAVTTPAWTTFHLDNARSGNDTTEPAFNSAAASWESPALDGRVYGEPLVLGGTVYVATMNDTVYALNAASGAVVWSNHVGTAVPGTSVPCFADGPTVGIQSTPVIDPVAGVLYAVGLVSPSNFVLFALDLNNSGHLIFSRDVDPPAPFTALSQGQRPALSLANGMVYVPFGGHDCGTYHGYIVGARTDNTEGAPLVYVDQDSTMNGAPFWGASGAAVDSAGNLYAATGNGSSTTTFDHGESVIKLSPGLTELDHWAPPNWANLNSLDADLGSMGPSLLDNGLLFQGSKTGDGYLLDPTHLGGTGAAPLFSAHVCGPLTEDAAFGGTAYSDPYVFMPCKNGLYGLLVSGSTFTVAWHYPASGPGFWAGPPVVAGGEVWVLDITHGYLIGVDPATGVARFSAPVGGVTHFSTPTAAGGRVFVGVNASPDLQSPHVISFSINPPHAMPGPLHFTSPFVALNTITGAGGKLGKLGAARSFSFKVRGAGPVPASATSVVVQLFGASASAQTSLWLWPSPLANPTTPQVSLGPGQVASNLVEVPLGASGALTIFNLAGSVNAAVIVVGWRAPASAASAGRLLAEAPFRVLDTTAGIGAPIAPIASGQTLSVQVGGVGPVPGSGVEGVSVDLTALNPASHGSLTVWPSGTAMPPVPTLEYGPGQSNTGHAYVQLGAGGAVNVFNSGPSGVDVAADTEGAFTDGTAAASPTGMLASTLSETLAGSLPAVQTAGALGPGQSVTLQVAGWAGVPLTGAGAVLVNLTAAGAASAGTLTAWSGDQPAPGTTELSYPVQVPAGNLVTVPLSSSGQITLYNSGASAVSITATVEGWFTS